MEKPKKTYYGAVAGFAIGGLGCVMLFFEQSKTVGPFLIGFGFVFGLMRLRGD